jgi:hypothetical protein
MTVAFDFQPEFVRTTSFEIITSSGRLGGTFPKMGFKANHVHDDD